MKLKVGSRNPEHKCSIHGLWLIKVAENEYRCSVCMQMDIEWMSKLITEQKLKILELEGKLDEREGTARGQG